METTGPAAGEGELERAAAAAPAADMDGGAGEGPQPAAAAEPKEPKVPKEPKEPVDGDITTAKPVEEADQTEVHPKAARETPAKQTAADKPAAEETAAEKPAGKTHQPAEKPVAATEQAVSEEAPVVEPAAATVEAVAAEKPAAVTKSAVGNKEAVAEKPVAETEKAETETGKPAAATEKPAAATEKAPATEVAAVAEKPAAETEKVLVSSPSEGSGAATAGGVPAAEETGKNCSEPMEWTQLLRKCKACSKQILDFNSMLTWETVEFCNEECLAKFQYDIGNSCANCKKTVKPASMGKYSVRFGYDIRQFCCSSCLEEFKKGLKVCTYCQKDISSSDSFLAPVGSRGQFKDFCSQVCMENYDRVTQRKDVHWVHNGSCRVCKVVKTLSVFFKSGPDRVLEFCGEPCFVAYKFVNDVTAEQCYLCRVYFVNRMEHCVYADSQVYHLCSIACHSIFVISRRRIVQCSWCKVKKYDLDMIRKANFNGQDITTCSINCLSLFTASAVAAEVRKTVCCQCRKSCQPLYHLTMSDSSLRSFCSYFCVMAYQRQFSKSPLVRNESEENQVPVPTGHLKKLPSLEAIPRSCPEMQMPVITNVQSLAGLVDEDFAAENEREEEKEKQKEKQKEKEKEKLKERPKDKPMPLTPLSLPLASPSPKSSVKVQMRQHVIVRAPPLPDQKNVATLVRPIVVSKVVSCKPNMADKETQTEINQSNTVLIPVPVPLYVPMPLPMYSSPFPVPVPIPLPIPIPIFIPTTRNSANGIMKEIKKIQVKIPTDPFEAELLMMAEMVAGEKKADNTDSESEEEDNAVGSAPEESFSPEVVDASNTFGEDMLQMALKMATELDEPAVDLEGALTANTITAQQTNEDSAGTEEHQIEEAPQLHHHQPQHPQLAQALKGKKRPNRPPKNPSMTKKPRRLSGHDGSLPLIQQPQPAAPPEPVEKPDANMCLKYTFGVNAWKQWVTTKNAELEKSSRRTKLFKSEILQLTADELNYSLCLFVKEVRKPNGSEYAPDTIYYLCLGIQQYLYENGRIDNIFTDPYYEKFTECLDEVAKKFSVLYNDSHYIVTRVEEEHLWESKQLGAHSPHVLLSTLMFFNTKHFNLTTVEEHMQLSFSHIMKHWKRNPTQPGNVKVTGSRNVLLRFYPPQNSIDVNCRKKKVYEQQENDENPLRCPVKLYEFYLSKCPESVKTRNDVFYLLPERSCVPDSPVWYSTMPLGREALEKMLHRVKMVKEINVALLTS